MGEVDPAALRERGVRFYLPFEDSPNAVVSYGASKPWSQKNLQFCAGKIGKAVTLSHAPDENIKKSDGSIGKVKSKSILAYEALGNVLPRRGTMAFWARTPWDGMNKDILSGSSFTGRLYFRFPRSMVMPRSFTSQEGRFISKHYLVEKRSPETLPDSEHGGAYPSFISISKGDRKRIGRELAHHTLPRMWPAFLRRLNQNRFKLGEET